MAKDGQAICEYILRGHCCSLSYKSKYIHCTSVQRSMVLLSVKPEGETENAGKEIKKKFDY